MDRPLVWVAVAMLAGVLGAAAGAVQGLAIPVVVVAVAAAGATVRYRDARMRAVWVAVAFVGVGAVQWALHRTPNSDPLSDYVAAHPEKSIRVAGTVRDTQLKLPGNQWAQFTVDVDSRVEGARIEPLSGRTAVRWSHAAVTVFPGERVTVTGAPRVAIAEVNPGVRGYEDYLRNRGVHSAIDASGPAAIEIAGPAPPYSPWYWAARLRQAQADRLALAMPADVLPFVYAIWLGHQGALDRTEYRDYVWSGTAHMLSVSGIHAAIVAMSLNFALRVLPIGRRTRAIAVMSAVFAFALVAGASVPALRAAVMVCLYLSADLLEREPDTPTALSIAGIVFMVWGPNTVFDSGFQLSFASVASILTFVDLVEVRLARLHRLVRAPLAVSLSVQILPLPIAAANFHVLPLAAPLTNLLAIPLLGAVLWLCFVTSLLSFAWLPAAQVAGYATWLPIAAIRAVAHVGSSLHPATLKLTTPTAPAWALYWTAAALLASSTAVRRERRRTVLIAAAVAFAVCAALWRPRGYGAEVVTLDVGHGDASFVRMPGGETLLIDGGDASEYGDRGQQIIAPFLWARGVTRLDAVVVTHNDRDHIGGLPYIVDNFRVETAVLGAVETDSDREREFLDRCGARGTRVVRVQRGATLYVGSAAFEVLHPTPDLSPDTLPNNLSVALRVPFGSKTFLFAGDIEEPVERTLAGEVLRADVLKVPHHGADTSSSPEFIDAVAPAYAVISTGSHGRRVLDDPIVQRYKAKGIAVLRTDRLGAIRFTLRGAELGVEAERIKRGYPIATD